MIKKLVFQAESFNKVYETDNEYQHRTLVSYFQFPQHITLHKEIHRDLFKY